MKEQGIMSHILSHKVCALPSPWSMKRRPMKRTPLYLFVVVFVLHFLSTFSDHAYAWSDNPNINTPICTESHSQEDPTIISDGSGGAIITWQDHRSGNYDIYAQGISSLGATQWSANGVAICTASHDQVHPTIISDGSGGAIITWQDGRSGNYDIYAQRIYKDGKLSGGCIVLPILQLLLLD
jgi:hypothetical protein